MTQAQYVPNKGGHLYKVLRCAKVCATIYNCFQLPGPAGSVQPLPILLHIHASSTPGITPNCRHPANLITLLTSPPQHTQLGHRHLDTTTTLTPPSQHPPPTVPMHVPLPPAASITTTTSTNYHPRQHCHHHINPTHLSDQPHPAELPSMLPPQLHTPRCHGSTTTLTPAPALAPHQPHPTQPP
ncbi:hypothetical protein EDB86DRAFT_3079426 [Lactarius hatsudake]|nr:hypothetical protein EDB86DRAFT_3079426 [Lactarius hatsudake]